MLKDWDDVPYGAADCVSGHVTWENMVDYIKHSGSCDTGTGYILYDDDASANQKFKFTYAGVISKSYGGADTGDDRQWFANSTDAYPYIEGLGSSHLKLYSGDDIYFYDNAEQAFKFSRTGVVSEIYGGADTGDDLLFQANTTDTYPIVSFLGDKYVYMQSDLSYVVTTARIPIFSEIAAARADECLNRMRQEFGHELWADPYYDSGDAHGEGAGAFQGGVLAPNGKIIFSPRDSANVGIYNVYAEVNKNTCLHPLFNKF